MKSLELRNQWGYSRTNESGWIKLCALIFYETNTINKTSSRNSTLSVQLIIVMICKSIFTTAKSQWTTALCVKQRPGVTLPERDHATGTVNKFVRLLSLFSQ